MSTHEETRTIAVIRNMAWDRAKGELNSMLQTIYGDQDKFEELESAISEFVNLVEENGLQE